MSSTVEPVVKVVEPAEKAAEPAVEGAGADVAEEKQGDEVGHEFI
jgi:hypothetical protein